MEEVYASHESTNLLGLEVKTEGRGSTVVLYRSLLTVGDRSGSRQKIHHRFNTFAPAARHRFMKLRTLLETPAITARCHQVQTRDSAHRYFRVTRSCTRSTLRITWRGGVKRRVSPCKNESLRLRICPCAPCISLIALLSISILPVPGNQRHPVRRLRCRCTGRFCSGRVQLFDRSPRHPGLDKERPKGCH